MPPPAGCGVVPSSSGPASAVAELRVAGPETAAAGSSIGVTVSVVARADGGRILTDPGRSQLLVTLGGRVVGRAVGPAVGPTGGPGLVPVVLSAGATRPAQAVPAAVLLHDCSPGAGSAAPLPRGRYGVVAVLGYGSDPLNGAAGGSSGQFQLVSAPTPVTVS